MSRGSKGRRLVMSRDRARLQLTAEWEFVAGISLEAMAEWEFVAGISLEAMAIENNEIPRRAAERRDKER